MNILRIFPPAARFDGIGYNTRKIMSGDAELLRVSGFGLLSCLSRVRPADYANYLKLVSDLNGHIGKPQFHAMISAKGRTMDKNSLADLTSAWLGEMGYGAQPYLLFFHKDTANNHVHMVSTGVTKQCKTITRRFERIRGLEALNRLTGLDEKKVTQSDIRSAMRDHCGSLEEFAGTLKSMGYKSRETAGGELEVIRWGRRQALLPIKQNGRSVTVAFATHPPENPGQAKEETGRRHISR